ncbi:hypothetical protein F750_1518 [Streptomyces sp. PAMC 26508]|nr:hypothetical protein F750_1518 [Streptomyces sp. PAMC 26508]
MTAPGRACEGCLGPRVICVSGASPALPWRRKTNSASLGAGRHPSVRARLRRQAQRAREGQP